jgi:hypothetical protein
VWSLLVIAAVTAALVGSARSGPPPRVTARVDVAYRSPVAGRLFTGASVVNLEPARTVIDWVKCNGRIGAKTVPARKQRFFDEAGRLAQIACSWRIPSGTGGQVLNIEDAGQGPRITVSLDHGATIIASPERNWKIVAP